MRLWIGVENFAKIEYAKICVDSYTMLVGPNNCGKTFLMQLVQGLGDKIANLIDSECADIMFTNEEPGCKTYVLDATKLEQVLERMNRNLSSRKEELIREIFGQEIEIGRLYIDAKLKDDEIYIVEVLDMQNYLDSFSERKAQRIAMYYDYFTKREEKMRMAILSQWTEKKDELMYAFDPNESDEGFLRRVLKLIFEKNSLFLPASRTGLMLLYRDFFANKTDDAVVYQIKEKKVIENKERYGGMTQPTYEFLRFLQTYVPESNQVGFYEDELKFLEEKLINGHISVSKQGTFAYSPAKESRSVPMHLASAMVNEVAPLALVLTSGKMYNRLVIDEVEASLHPQKQHELARFLNRLSNNHMSLMVSTHSDTFVSKLNNLYLLSEYIKSTNDEMKLKEFGLELDDLVATDNLFVYEFVFQENGKSIVNEIIPNKNAGYQFDLFTKSTLDLYAEASRIGELQ